VFVRFAARPSLLSWSGSFAWTGSRNDGFATSVVVRDGSGSRFSDA